MQLLLDFFIKQSVSYLFIIIMIVTFLESLALIGLLLPGTMLMACFGALIGSGEVNFWEAWIAGIIGCLFGDWFSFWLGWRFKKSLNHWSFIKKNKVLLENIAHALYRHNMITILVGRFLGPTRSLVPMVAGMVSLPITKFIAPNILGCLFWAPCYFLPGIITGAAIVFPNDKESNCFKYLLLITILLLWLTIWLCWSFLYRKKINFNFFFLIVLLVVTLMIMIALLIKHPLMTVYSDILLKIIKSSVLSFSS